MTARSIAVQGLDGTTPLTMATQGFMPVGILISPNGIPIGVQLGTITLSFASPAEIQLGSIVPVPGLGPIVAGVAGAKEVILGSIRAVVRLGRHGFGVPAPLSELWTKLSHGVTRSIRRLVTQWRSR